MTWAVLVLTKVAIVLLKSKSKLSGVFWGLITVSSDLVNMDSIFWGTVLLTQQLLVFPLGNTDRNAFVCLFHLSNNDLSLMYAGVKIFCEINNFLLISRRRVSSLSLHSFPYKRTHPLMWHCFIDSLVTYSVVTLLDWYISSALQNMVCGMASEGAPWRLSGALRTSQEVRHSLFSHCSSGKSEVQQQVCCVLAKRHYCNSCTFAGAIF